MIIAVVVIGLIFAGIYITKQQQNRVAQASQTTNSSNVQDLVPGMYPNEIKNKATTVGFTIKSVAVENNTNPTTGNVVSDHLEVSLVNTTSQPLSNFEVYYTMTDTKTQQQESYYKKLTGFTLAAHTTATIHFDNKTGQGHFTANKSSLYYKSTNAISFAVQISTPGYAVQNAQVTKAAGGAETKD